MAAWLYMLNDVPVPRLLTSMSLFAGCPSTDQNGGGAIGMNWGGGIVGFSNPNVFCHIFE